MTEPSLRIGIACYPSVGGSGILATALGVDLARRGHEVHFISYERPFRLPPDEPRVTFHPVHIQGYGLFKHPDYTLPLAVKMTEVVRERRLHILHAHYAVPHATAAVLARDWLPEELRPGVVATLHGTDTTLLGTRSRLCPRHPPRAGQGRRHHHRIRISASRHRPAGRHRPPHPGHPKLLHAAPPAPQPPRRARRAGTVRPRGHDPAHVESAAGQAHRPAARGHRPHPPARIVPARGHRRRRLRPVPRAGAAPRPRRPRRRAGEREPDRGLRRRRRPQPHHLGVGELLPQYP
jgi:hypothetical protein